MAEKTVMTKKDIVVSAIISRGVPWFTCRQLYAYILRSGVTEEELKLHTVRTTVSKELIGSGMVRRSGRKEGAELVYEALFLESGTLIDYCNSLSADAAAFAEHNTELYDIIEELYVLVKASAESGKPVTKEEFREIAEKVSVMTLEEAPNEVIE